MTFTVLAWWHAARWRGVWPALAMCAASAVFGTGTPAYANLIIDATFDSSITSLPGASSVEAAINAADGVLEANISTNITVSIDFQNMTSGLGESTSGIYTASYYDYYNALKAINTAPGASAAQLAAFASLGLAPTGESSPNPVNGSTSVAFTAPMGRALGFNAPALVTGPGGTYDTIIGLNTSITSPPNGLSGNYGLQAVATHEIDEALGVGGTGSSIGAGYSGNPVGVLDLYRYSAPGVRSWSTVQTTSPYSYFSIDGGNTVLSYFNQTAGADYGDWLSNPIPTGFSPQLQDAFGAPGTDPALGVNELTALNVVGYDLTSQENPVPEPMSLAIMLPGVLGLISLRRRARTA
jgi:hypothetical protein